MPSFRSLILLHGYSFLFCYVLAVQVGAPIPADPILLIMGASVGDGRYSFVLALFLAVAAALTGDLLWYELGRWKGRSILRLFCRFALEPDTCVRKTELDFSKRGPWALLFTKFIPGSGLISTPLAGAIRMPRWRFLLADAAGATIWSATYLMAGALFHREIDHVVVFVGLFGRRAGLVLVVLLSTFLACRYFGRVRFRRELRINRLTPEAALSLMNNEPPPIIVDLRSPKEIEETGRKIQGAQVFRPAELRKHFEDIPRDRDVILYCT